MTTFLKAPGEHLYKPTTHVNVYTSGTGHPSSVWDPVRDALPCGATRDVPINFNESAIQQTAAELLQFRTVVLGSASLGTHMQMLISEQMADQAATTGQELPHIDMVTIDPFLGKDYMTPEEQDRRTRIQKRPAIITALARKVSEAYGLAQEKVVEQMSFIANDPPEALRVPNTIRSVKRMLAIRSLRDTRISESTFDYLKQRVRHFTRSEVEADHAQLPEHPDVYARAISDYYTSKN